MRHPLLHRGGLLIRSIHFSRFGRLPFQDRFIIHLYPGFSYFTEVPSHRSSLWLPNSQAPTDARTSRTLTTCPEGAPFFEGSVDSEYCVLAMQMGRSPNPCAS